MKKITLIISAVLLSCSSAFAQVDVETDPALPVTFDETWGQNFLVKKTGVSVGDKFIFTAETMPKTGTWQWGSQVLPKSNNTGWAGLGEAISVTANGDCTFTVTANYADSINTYGGLRVQGVDVKVTAVKYQTAADPSAEQTYVFDVTKTDQLWTGTTNDGTGLITFPAAWTGAGWWIQSMDLSPYKSVVFELAEAATIDLLPQIFAKAADGTTDANVSKTMSAGTTIIGVDLNTSAKTYSTVMMQNFAAGTCKLKKVYLSSMSADDAVLKATGIEKISADKTMNTSAPIYNIAGQKVGSEYKGIVIQNGKKFIQK